MSDPFLSCRRHGLVALSASLIASAFLAASAGPAGAQQEELQLRTDVSAPREFRYELGVIGGGQYFSKEHTLGRQEGDSEDQSPAHAGTVGVLFGVNVNRYLSVEAEALGTRTNTRDFLTDLWIFQLGGHLRLHPATTGRVQPYLTLGYGAIASWADDESVQANDQDGVGRAGLGLRIGLSQRLNLRLEGRVQSSMAFASDVLAVGDETGYGGPDFLGLATISVNVGATRPKLLVAEREVVKDPETLDDDGDGLINRADRCPKVAEDIDRYEDEDGCPDEDNDKDGIADAKDRCPLRAETMNQIDDLDGCPEEDEDNDGIFGSKDECPTVAEVKNGFKDLDGCADELPEDVKRFTGVIQGINFKTRSAVLLRGSYPLLDRAIVVLKQYPDLKLEVAGHTDGRGKGDFNRDLSQKRAESVREYFVSKGIEAPRVVAVGYGMDRPIDTNKTEKGRSKNRRIEFRLLTAEALPLDDKAAPGTGSAAPSLPGTPPSAPVPPGEAPPAKPATP
jgi:OmpA-OmpF porin, OOP family